MVNNVFHCLVISTQKQRGKRKRNRKVIQKEEENRGKRRRQKQSIDELVAQSTGWDSLPSEIQEEIVLRVVSVYDLGRLKLVSKSLLYLISSDDFIYAHLARVPPKPQLSYVFTEGLRRRKPDYCQRRLHRLLAFEIEEDGSTTTLHNRSLNLYTLPGLTKHDYITLESSCNGLLLIRASACRNHNHGAAGKGYVRLFVCNPVTRISTELHNLGYVIPGHSWSFTFGYDDRSRTYKVARIRVFGTPCRSEISVYTLGSSGRSPWRVLDYKFYHNPVGSDPVITTDGRWILMAIKGRGYCLFSMDWNKELLRETSLPPSTTACRPNALYEINGCLYCAYERFQECVEIWALRMDCCWVKEHVVSMDSILTAIYEVPGPLQVAMWLNIINVGSTSEGKKLMFYSPTHEKLVSYDLQTQKVMLIKFDEEGSGSKYNNSTFRSQRWIDLPYTLVSSLVN